ncbi:hypothetical protein E2C01_042624 [Portunus trituberculatus]|uniref:Uncharacterized protein n=1 Tax=Portunus trituberculatus TaxID=210409 RepID=A0A5B7FU42_PORTR|nr:hypothetical protein [Portunus trituberculatus]
MLNVPPHALQRLFGDVIGHHLLHSSHLTSITDGAKTRRRKTFQDTYALLVFRPRWWKCSACAHLSKPLLSRCSISEQHHHSLDPSTLKHQKYY